MIRPLMITLPILAALAGCSSPDTETEMPDETDTMAVDDGTATAPGTLSPPTDDMMNDPAQTSATGDGDAAQRSGQTPAAPPPVNDDMRDGTGSDTPRPGEPPAPDY
jgi:hypothetical protein